MSIVALASSQAGPTINVTCLMTFFSSAIIAGDKWDLCEEDPHCLCGKWGMQEPLCAPPDVVESVCGMVDGKMVGTYFI